MKTNLLKISFWLCVLLALNSTLLRAQTIATWTGPATGGEWNTAADWSTLEVPGNDANGMTNAVIGSGTNVSYNLPMAAASFGSLTENGVLNINTNGFNCSSISLILPTGGDIIYMNTGAVVTAGSFTMTTNSRATLYGGASLTISGALDISFGTSSHAAGTSYFTNSGGTLSANSTAINNNSGTGTGLLVINGGTNNLGTVEIGRYNSSGLSTPGNEGLAIYGGLVLMTNLNVGGGYAASYDTAYMTGGVVTNFGSVFLNNLTAGRYSRFLQTGGLFVVPDPGVVNPNSTVAGTQTAVYTVNGGTNIVGGFYFGNSNNAAAATENLTNAGTIYVGSQGIADNGGVVFNISLNNGGLFGATASWLGAMPMTLATGTFTFRTADPSGNPFDITLSSVVGGPGTLNKTGAGELYLGAANTYSGKTLVSAGTLALSAGGSIASSSIVVGTNSTFDVTANGGISLNNQALGGFGVVTGDVSVATGSAISPGSNSVTGNLTILGSLTESGGAANNFSLSSNPSGPNNDLVTVAGDLTVSGTNNLAVSGSLPNGATYPLFAYTGTFSGSVSNFALSGAVGVITNNPSAKTISLITLATVRGPTNIVWLGNPLNTNWDTGISTNWLNGTSLDYFIPNDNVTFNNIGASNGPVNVVGTVTPSFITVNSTSNYVFAGTGAIGGTGGLTVTNTGTVTILTTNTYSSFTTIEGGGTLLVSQVANSLTPSAIGESGSMVISNGTFSYNGPGASIDLSPVFETPSSAIDVSTNGNLTLDGSLTGPGGLTVAGAGTLILNGASSFAGTTTLSNGTLEVNGVAGLGVNPVSFDGGTLYFESQSVQTFYANAFNVATIGTIYFAGANADNIIGTSGGDGSIAGTGVLNIDIPNAGVYCTLNENIESFAGTIHLTADSLGIFRFNSGANATSPQFCTGSTNATFDLGNGGAVLANRNGGGAEYGNYDLGALAGDTNTFLEGCLDSSSGSTYSIGANNLSTTFAGTIQAYASSAGTVAITKVGTGTLTLFGQNSYTGPTIVNSGVLALSYNPTNLTDGAINNSASFTVAAGAFIDVSGRSDGTLNVATSLQGSGTIRGILNASGVVSPGGGVTGGLGTLTVTNTINLSGTTWMKLDRASGPNSDRLVSSTAGTNNYGGTLIVTNIGGPLHIGDTFTLFSGTSLNGGTFGSIVLPDYYVWNTSNLGVNGTISVTGILPPPVFAGVDFSQLASGTISLNASNGAPSGAFTVLSTTNLALPVSSWTTVTTGNFDGNGNLTEFPITVDPLAPEEFYLLLGQ